MPEHRLPVLGKLPVIQLQRSGWLRRTVNNAKYWFSHGEYPSLSVSGCHRVPRLSIGSGTHPGRLHFPTMPLCVLYV